MIIEQPPFLYRLFFRGAHWRFPEEEKTVYLTFDDGPIPEMTPRILDTLDRYGVKATFFCVGDNVVKYPHLYQEILKRGHRVGNHTFNHIQGIKTRSKNYIANIDKAAEVIDSKLFRAPHGHIRRPQFVYAKQRYKIIMWDVVTRDYNPHLSADQVFRKVKKYTRKGSIIVFHDSIKAIGRIEEALPLSVEWLLGQGYTFKLIEED